MASIFLLANLHNLSMTWIDANSQKSLLTIDME